jgi:trypsin
MKLLIVLLAVVAGALAANIRGKSFNGLRATLVEQGVFRSRAFGHRDISTRIVGGNPGDINSIPYIIALHEIGWGQICGGIIIAATRVITAAHCTEWFPEYPLEVQAGSNNINAGGQRVLVTAAIDHPQYDYWTLENDISVLHLAGPLNLALPGIATIAMPVQGAGTAVGTSARVSGWGALYEGHPGVDLLRYVLVPVISNADCNALYGGGITAGMLCAGFPEGGRDACQGDSGGPLTAGNQVIGVVSWGYGCARPNLPGVYARVSYYRNWIDSNL